jgi:hypothetical protein
MIQLFLILQIIYAVGHDMIKHIKVSKIIIFFKKRSSRKCREWQAERVRRNILWHDSNKEGSSLLTHSGIVRK